MLGSSPATQMTAICSVIERSNLRFCNEAELQNGIALRLESSGIPFEREVRLDAHDRIDFMVGEVGIEVKVDDPLAKVTRQVHRYVQHDRIGAVLLVTSRSRHRALPASLNGKPISVLYLMGSAL